MSTFLGLSFGKIVVFSAKFRKNRKLGFSTENVKIRNFSTKNMGSNQSLFHDR